MKSYCSSEDEMVSNEKTRNQSLDLLCGKYATANTQFLNGNFFVLGLNASETPQDFCSQGPESAGNEAGFRFQQM